MASSIYLSYRATKSPKLSCSCPENCQVIQSKKRVKSNPARSIPAICPHSKKLNKNPDYFRVTLVFPSSYSKGRNPIYHLGDPAKGRASIPLQPILARLENLKKSEIPNQDSTHSVVSSNHSSVTTAATDSYAIRT